MEKLSRKQRRQHLQNRPEAAHPAPPTPNTTAEFNDLLKHPKVADILSSPGYADFEDQLKKAYAEDHIVNSPDVRAADKEEYKQRRVENGHQPLHTAIPVATPPRASVGGPVTPEGKARSSQNSFKHGLASGFGHFKLLAGEDPAEYAELLCDVRAQFVPRTGAERKKIEDMAQAWWLQRRARNLQTSALESADDKAFALYLRYETTQRRSYQMAYKDFQDMCKQRLAAAASPDLTPIVTPTSVAGPRIYPTREPVPTPDPPLDQLLAS
jgi:hypothetical protein